MHNQHAELSQLLAAQRITQRHEQATHARLTRSAHPPRRRRSRAARDRWQLVWSPSAATEQPLRCARSVLTSRHRGGGEHDVHVYMKQQLASDRVAELRAGAHRARHQRVRRAQRASKADQALARREWRVLVQALMAR